MGEGFPLWSMASMAGEGQKPLRDWICLSLCFCILDSGHSPFLIFPKIRNSDWAEILTQFLSGYLLSCRKRRAPTALRRGHKGPGHALAPGARPLPCRRLGHRLALIPLPKIHIYSKKYLRKFYPIWTPIDIDFLQNKKHATNRNWHWALDQ